MDVILIYTVIWYYNWMSFEQYLGHMSKHNNECQYITTEDSTVHACILDMCIWM